MKKVLILLMMASVLLGACQDSVQVDANWIADGQGYYLELDTTDLTIDNPAGGSASFNVHSEGTPWIITDVPDWIELSVNKGSSSTPVTVRASEYKRAGDRYCLLKFSSDTGKWPYNEYISVTQVGWSPKIALAKNMFAFDGNAHEETVAASSNFTWRIANGYQWLSIVQKEDAMVVSVTINDTGRDRNAKVDITAEDSEKLAVIEVSQAVAKATVAQDPIRFSLTGGTCELTVTSEAPWKVSNSSSWWGVNPRSGEPGTTEVTIRTNRNDVPGDRSDKIGFCFAQAFQDFATIEISQEGAYLELSDESSLKRLSSLGGETHLTLNTNIPWEITEVPDYLTVTPMSGEGTTDLTLTYPSNQSLDGKGGYLTIGWVDHNSRWSYWTRQRAREPFFENGATSVTVACGPAAQTLSLGMDMEGPWSIVYDRTFFDITPTSATGPCTFTITVDKNETGQIREGLVNIRPHGVPTYDDSQPSKYYFTVRQYGEE